jgi:hypothetical protein
MLSFEEPPFSLSTAKAMPLAHAVGAGLGATVTKQI